jgi:hypothetical protein
MSGKSGHRGWGWIRKRASGRYQASYIGPDDKRHHAPNTFQNKMAAEAWLARERQGIDNARAGLLSSGGGRLEWISPAQRMAAADEAFASAMTLEEFGRNWIAQRDIKPRSRIHYEAILQRHIAPKLGKINVEHLRPATIRS